MYFEPLSPIEVSNNMSELMSSTRFPLSVLYKRLSLSPSNVLCVFVVGSRLWGTASYDSDWDFTIVLRRFKKRRSFIHSGNIDACVLDVDEYRERVLKHHHFTDVYTLWLPPSHVWLSSIDLRREFSSCLDPRRFVSSIEDISSRDWRVSEKMWGKGKTHKAKKIIVHSLAMAILSTRIISSGELVPADYSCGYEHYCEIMGGLDDDASWDDLRASFHPQHESLMQRLRDSSSSRTRG